MRRTVLFVLMITVCLSGLLAGCAGGTDSGETLTVILSELSEAETVTAQAKVTGSGEEYDLKCVLSGEDCEIEVLLPEIISGVKATVSGKDMSLSYGDVVISVGGSYGDLNPVSAIPLLIQTLRSGWMASSWNEECLGTDCIAARFRVSDSSVMTVWIDPNVKAPLYAEFDNNGTVVLSCTFESWII